MKKLGILDVKQAILGDSRFRELFPELKEDFDKILNNPSCACNKKMYHKVFEYKDRLKKYFPDREIAKPENKPQNYWSVINCKAIELQKILNNLHKHGRKQIAIARYEDQLTVVICEIV